MNRTRSGGLVDARVQGKFRVVPCEEIPKDLGGLAEWPWTGGPRPQGVR